MRYLSIRRMTLLIMAAAVLVWVVPGSHASPARPARTGGSDGGVVVALRLDRQAALNRYVAGLYKSGSASFHHFLTAPEFAARFGASRVDVTKVMSTLRGLGLTDSTVSANHLYVSVKRIPTRRGHIDGAISSALHGLISGVISPSDMPRLTPELTSLGRAATHVATNAKPAGAAQAKSAVRQGVNGGSTPCIAAATSGGYTAPALASGYNFNALYAAGFHGEGMSAAVIEYGGYHSGNVSGFEKCYGISTPVSRVLVDGGSGAPAGPSETEVALDIEVILEMAPKLGHVYVYEAPNTGTGEIGAYNDFVTQDRAPVLSVSWGECEQGSSQSYERLLGVITEEAAAQGQQIFVAAGDSGSKGCDGDSLPTGHSLSADSEASLPWVTAVGGTDLSEASTEAGATVHREDVWDDGLGAGGGGQSVAWTMPSWQQSYLAASGDHPAGLANDCRAPKGDFCRMEPDISLDADAEEGGADPHYWGVPAGPAPAQFSSVGDRGAPGYAIYCTSSDCSAGGTGWQRVGGTSAATPLAASAALLWDQEAEQAGVSLGFLNPALYAVASNATSYARDFYDVTTGNNNDLYTGLACDVGCSSKLYPAGKGYDMATGLGSINVGNLGLDLLSDAGAISATPSVEQMYGYTRGGPSTTAPVSVTAPSAAGAGTGYTATSNAGWLSVSSTGTSPDSLRWHVDPAGLTAGRYTGTITITAADASSATLTVVYNVTAPARIRLLTRSLHFSEHQVRPFGEKKIRTCVSPLWGDELETNGVLPGLDGVSVAGDEIATARRTLAFVNGGSAGSVLHYSVDQTHVAWISNDLDPTGHPRAVPQKPGQPLVPSEGSLARGVRQQVKLASLANANTVGGYPALQQGTYHGRLIIRDLADPADTVSVPVTLTLGNGRGTPRIAVVRHSLAIAVSPGQTKSVSLGLKDPGATCGYGYSLETSSPWLSVGAKRRTGTVGPTGVRRVPVTVTAAADMPAGTYHASITVASLNAAAAKLVVPVTLTVR